MRVLAQGRIVDRHETKMQMHQQLLAHIAHARTRLRSVEVHASAIQWMQPYIMRELCSVEALRNLTSHTCTVENAKSVLTRSIQDHRRSRPLPLPTSHQRVSGQAVHRIQNLARSQSLPPATSKGLCVRQAVPARRATDPPPAAHPSRPSVKSLHVSHSRSAAVPSSLSLGSSPSCAGAGGARQSRLTAGTLFIAGPIVAEPRQCTYPPLPGAPATGVVDAMSVLVEFLEVAQRVWVPGCQRTAWSAGRS